MFMTRMSRVIKFLILFFCFLNISAGVWAKTEGKLYIKHTTINLGVIHKDALIRHFNIEFENRGHVNLKITKVIPDCDCTTVTYNRKALLPKGKDKIMVEVNLTGFLPGEIEKEIAVYSNSSEKPIIVTIKGDIIY